MPLAEKLVGELARREGIDGRHADHDVAGLGPLDDAAFAHDHRLGLVGGLDDQDRAIDRRRHRLGVAGKLGALGAHGRGLALVDVVDHQLVAGLREIERHRPAHGAEPDESDLAGHVSFSPQQLMPVMDLTLMRWRYTPPVTSMVRPVTKSASDEARKQMTLAWSAASATRRNGVRSISSACEACERLSQ